MLALDHFGGSSGIRDYGRLESVLASQRQQIFGAELYVDIFQKVATLCRRIIGDHPFSNGNKCTAMLTALVFLEINEKTFAAARGEIEDFAVHIAVEHLDISAIADWLSQHTNKT